MKSATRINLRLKIPEKIFSKNVNNSIPVLFEVQRRARKYAFQSKIGQYYNLITLLVLAFNPFDFRGSSKVGQLNVMI